MARLTLDPSWAERYFKPDHGLSQSVLACALIAIESLTPPGKEPDKRWLEVALGVLSSHGFAQFGRKAVMRFPSSDELLDQLLRDPALTADHIELLARYDDPRVFERMVPYVAEYSLGDAPILRALEDSAHVAAAHTAHAIVATLHAQRVRAARLKPFKAVAKALGERFSVKAPKLAKAPPPPAPEVAEAPAPARPALPPVAELEAELRKTFEQAGLAARFDALVSPAAAILTERADAATIPVGASRLGGLPDLPADVEWPAAKKAPLTFVGQLDLEDLAGFQLAAWRTLLPAAGLLSFFVHDMDPENYARKGVVLYVPPGAALGRHEVPAAFIKAGRIPACACRVELVETLRLVHPSARAVEFGMAFDQIQAYQKLHENHPQVGVSTLLGHRDRYDGEVKRGYRLLLQVTSDPQANFEWGDLDELAFFVAEKALVAREFKSVDVRVGD